MILSQVQSHIDANGPLTLQQLSKHFGVQPEALEGMLGLLIKKGKITRLEEKPSCGGCTSCDGYLMTSFTGQNG